MPSTYARFTWELQTAGLFELPAGTTLSSRLAFGFSPTQRAFVARFPSSMIEATESYAGPPVTLGREDAAHDGGPAAMARAQGARYVLRANPSRACCRWTGAVLDRFDPRSVRRRCPRPSRRPPGLQPVQRDACPRPGRRLGTRSSWPRNGCRSFSSTSRRKTTSWD